MPFFDFHRFPCSPVAPQEIAETMQRLLGQRRFHHAGVRQALSIDRTQNRPTASRPGGWIEPLARKAPATACPGCRHLGGFLIFTGHFRPNRSEFSTVIPSFCLLGLRARRPLPESSRKLPSFPIGLLFRVTMRAADFASQALLTPAAGAS